MPSLLLHACVVCPAQTLYKVAYPARSACKSAQACLKALSHAVPGQRVNCIPGISALTDKRRLIETLVRTYGEGAFQIVPRTFLLPEQYLEWRAWMRAHAVRSPFLLFVEHSCRRALWV